MKEVVLCVSIVYFFLSSLRMDSSADVAMRSFDSSKVSRAEGSGEIGVAVDSDPAVTVSIPQSHSIVTEKARESRKRASALGSLLPLR